MGRTVKRRACIQAPRAREERTLGKGAKDRQECLIAARVGNDGQGSPLGGSRTHMTFRPADFESTAYSVPPLGGVVP